MQRKCIGCGKIQDRGKMIKITRKYPDDSIVINGDSYTFGRSVYLCYNESCIEAVFKKNKISKFIKASVPNELKGQLLNELRNSYKNQ